MASQGDSGFDLEDSVHLAGWVSDARLSAYYQCATIYAATSQHEGFCVPLVEAMAFGAPIVALAHAAVPETVGDAGVVLRDADPHVFASAVGELMAETRRREELIKRRRARYERRFTNHVVGRQLVECVGRLQRDGQTISSGREIADRLTPVNAAESAGRYIRTIPNYPGDFEGRGIVICADGVKYYTNAWTTIRLLRRLGCRVPIQVWYRGEREHDRQWASLAKPWGVECIDAETLTHASTPA